MLSYNSFGFRPKPSFWFSVIGFLKLTEKESRIKESSSNNQVKVFKEVNQ